MKEKETLKLLDCLDESTHTQAQAPDEEAVDEEEMLRRAIALSLGEH